MAVITSIERKSRRWERVWQGDSEAVASIVAGRLEAEGIRTRVHGSATPYRTAALALGGTWNIAVVRSNAERARDLLHEYEESHNIISLEDEEAFTANQRLSLTWAARALVVLGIVLALLLILEAR